jgi:hypothetical protein
MASRSSINQSVQVGVETTAGTAVAASRRLGSVSVSVDPDVKSSRHTPDGDKFDSVVTLDTDASKVDVKGKPDFEELTWLLDAVVGNRVTTDLGGGAYQHVFHAKDRGCDTYSTLTVERGSTCGNAVRAAGVVLTGLTLEAQRSKSADVKSEGFGLALETGLYLTGNEVQQVAVTGGTPTSGTFTLTYSGQTTSGIARNANAAAVQAALEALSTIGAGNVVCTGGALPGTAVRVQFVGDLAQTNVASLTAADTFDSGDITITTVTAGAAPTSTVLQPITTSLIDVYVDTTAAGLGTTKVARPLKTTWAITDRFTPAWYLNTDNASWGESLESKPSQTVKVTVPADDAGLDLGLGNIRRGDVVFVRVAAVGGEIASSGENYELSIDVAAQVEDVGPLSDEDGAYAYELTLRAVFDPTWAKSHEVTLTNSIASL